MNPLDKRIRALHWLFAAMGSWLFRSQNSQQQFPPVDDGEWESIGDMAWFHNIEPLLYWMLSNAEISADIPKWLKQRWEQAYFGNFLRNEEYLDILNTLLTEYQKKGIPVIVLKGPALIARIYRDPALRTLSDLDILCSRRDLQQIVNISSRMGYTIMADGDDPATAHHVAMNRAESETILEFHFIPYDSSVRLNFL